jgi:hypothetical protein
MSGQEDGTQVDRMQKDVLAFLAGALLTRNPVPGENRADHESRSGIWK